ncbi:hypothetical protein E0L36_18865 [Streptomyces sp. AJS327]|uniref:HAD family hydrolase n=1 Tax=Streptomyces sp. AJS327 TaxID=2545265 RepID=UPI0015DF66B6|nr:HAD-IB family phosphatase [Streptomyces sp. AJS327]MBA0052859.1 hypothetical protein [Streptomyces sp. AJS327]
MTSSLTRPRLHLFDLDGTLIRGSAAAVEISRQLGVEREIAELERGFAAREMTAPEFALRACEVWHQLVEEHVDAAFTGAPWLSGIREVWAGIRERGDHCAVISLSPHFFVRRLLDWGLDAAHGSVWPEVAPRVPGARSVYPSEPLDPSGILSGPDKVRIADELCGKFGLSRSDCVAYGDSMSDVDLFSTVPVSVAVNADQHVSGLASHQYTGGDLREAYQLVGER